jgi:hypothetical protein
VLIHPPSLPRTARLPGSPGFVTALTPALHGCRRVTSHDLVRQAAPALYGEAG